MNNRESYFKVIEDFINHPNSRILLLKGKWGIGKTYFWKDFISRHLSILNFRAYSYVSLFGLDYIKSIKAEIFGNAIILDKEWDFLSKMSFLHKLISYAQKLPFINKNKFLVKLKGVTKISPLLKEIPFLKNYQGMITSITFHK